MSPSKFCPTPKFLQMHLQESIFNGSQATLHFLLSRNQFCWLPGSYVTFIQWVLHKLSQKASRTVSAKGSPYANDLWFLMFPRKTLFKRQCLPSRMTRVSRLQLEKMWNYVSSSGIAGCAKPFSCMWVWLLTWSRNKDTSKPRRSPWALRGATWPGKAGQSCSGWVWRSH